MKKVIAILLIALSISVFCAEKYAVLIAGDYNATNVPRDKKWNNGLGDNSEFWNDLYLQWEMLYQKGYKKENITVIFANGIDHWKINDEIDTRYRAVHATDNPEETITNYSATKTKLKAAVDALKLEIKPDDFLYVWAMSHGGSSTQSSICLIDPTGDSYYDMTDTEFASYFNTIIANKKVFAINANYAGGFLNTLKADNSFVQVSSTDTKSFRADDKIKDGTYIPFLENEEINDKIYYHGETCYHNYCATVGLTPSGADNYNGIPLSNADGDVTFPVDGLISVLETATWASEYESSTENPTWGNSWLIGYSSSLQYPTILRNSWNQGEAISNFGLRGICAVPEDILLEYDDFFDWTSIRLEENSYTTLFQDTDIDAGKYSSINIENNSSVIGMGNNTINIGGGPFNNLRLNNNYLKKISIINSGFLWLNGTTLFDNASLNFIGGSIYLMEGITTATVNFFNRSSFSIRNCNFNYEKDGIIYKSTDYLESIPQESKSLDNIYINIDNSDFIMDEVFVDYSFIPIEIKNNSNVIVNNDAIAFLVFYLSSGSKFIMNANSKYAEGGIRLGEGTELIINENGLYASGLSISDDVDVKLYNNSRLMKSLVLTNNCEVQIQENSKFTIEPGYNFTFNSGSKLSLLNGSELVVPETSVLTFEEGSQIIIEGNAKITGNIQISNGASIIIHDNSTLVLHMQELVIFPSTDLKLGINAKLIIENGTTLTIKEEAVIELAEGAGIVVQYGGSFTASGTSTDKVTFYYTGTTGNWLGINCLGGSSVDINNSIIRNASTGVYGTGTYKFNITNTVFEGCTNGINLLGMQPGFGYTITDNTLTGTDNGWGIFITGSDGLFSRNIVNHFNIGTYFVMSSPVVSKCDITYNKYFGIVVSGHDALPQLLNTEDNQPFGAVNCTIQKNAYLGNSSLFPSAQIGINPTGSIYMRYNDIISSPNFYGISIAQEDLRDPDQLITIDAQLNNWGSNIVTDDYFFEHPQYIIDYTPIWTLADEEESNSYNSDISEESRILINAIELEAKDKLTPAIKLYEHIIKKYVDTPEYYVAMARLPYLYEQAELDNNVLIALYDEALNSDATSHKKFFKGKKVATHIKGKRYDEAISLAEEMKAEAAFEEEVLLADINIAIANLLKDMEGKSRSGVDYAQNLRDLQSKLTDNESKAEPSGITESVLPTVSTLYQNYPNPFNPVTQIKFDLAKSAKVRLSVYNVNGQVVAELASGVMNAGNHAVDFDGSKLNSGVYYYTLEADGIALTKKMVLTK